MKSRRRVAVLGVAVFAVTSVATTVGATGVVPPANPKSNVTAVPAYSFSSSSRYYQVGKALPACWGWGARSTAVIRPSGKHCVPDEVAATNRAQRSEALGNIGLPSNFAKLNPVDQLLVLTDIERVSRGEAPVLGVVLALNPYAQQGAAGEFDPELPVSDVLTGETGAYASNFAAGVNALDANYQWMYTDGWNGKHTLNLDCTSSTAAGCWGHRDNILVNDSRMPCLTSACSLVMGAGFVRDGSHDGYNTYTELFVQVSGVTPTLSYSWQQALASGARA